MFNSILVVCTGNICRSPIAERILRNEIKNIQVDSAGLSALKGHSADLSAIRVAKKNGVSLEGHKGKQFSSEMARQYDLVLVMDKGHLAKISQIAPEVRGKTMLLGHWLEKIDIPDPYKQSDEAFDFVYKLIEQSCKLWIEKILG